MNARIFRRDALALRLIAIAVSAAWAGGAHAGGSSSMFGLGTLGGPESFPGGLSLNGTVVVGGSQIAGGDFRAFRWSGGVMTDLGTLPGGTHAFADAISADGRVVVGGSKDAAGVERAVRWSGGGVTDLGTLGGAGGWAFGVSANGTVVVGIAETADGLEHAFRWSGGTMHDLGTLGGPESVAFDVSGDGTVIVGQSRTTGGHRHAFRWSGGAMSDLGTLGGTSSSAWAVSLNGAVVVGSSDTGGGEHHAFRWHGGVMTDLGTLGGNYSTANGVSANGEVVVGRSTVAGGGGRAFRWTTGTGMQAVSDWLADAGVTVPTGWTLESGEATNVDGLVVVGYGENPAGDYEAWLARVAPTGSGFINPAAFDATVIEAGARAAQAGASLPNLALFGAHHRSLLDAGLARTQDGLCAWATADAAGYDDSDTRAELAEVGLCKDVGSARFGVGVGRAWARQDWQLGGDARYDGQYVIAELANAFAGGLEASVTGYYGRFDADLRRHYHNGAIIDRSVGRPDARSSALRVRLDWKDFARTGGLVFSPYAAYTHTWTTVDGYTETGGGFPVAYGTSKWRSGDLRAGLAAATALSERTALRIAGEAAHRTDDSTDGVKGQVIGLWDFSLPGEKVKQNWMRVTVDVDHRFSARSVLTVGASAATDGGDPNWGLTLGYRASF